MAYMKMLGQLFIFSGYKKKHKLYFCVKNICKQSKLFLVDVYFNTEFIMEIKKYKIIQFVEQL